MISLYNSLTGQKEPFNPIHPPRVGMYVCGLTVYDHCHIGHGRLFVWFDVVVRYLRSRGYQVIYVRNITDIDDKIITKSRELGISCSELTNQIIHAMHRDAARLQALPPDFEPRVTEHLSDIIEMISTLIDKGFAYLTPAGDVYYQVAKFTNYGVLAHQELDQLISGMRTEIDHTKRNPLDFALWKATKPGEPYWPSPWGDGRPGWHIECSAMARKYLGPTIDIHGGGCDLLFPHHQNELAQSEAANGEPFVNYWMHIGFVQNNQEKMSKSLGNSFALHEILDQYHPEVFRYFVLTSHYRSPLNFTAENLENAELALRRLYIALRNWEMVGNAGGALSTNSGSTTPLNALSSPYLEDFHAAMEDDLNTPRALAVLFDLVRELNQCSTQRDYSTAQNLAQQLRQLSNLLGLLQDSPSRFLKYGVDADAIAQIVSQREQARRAGNWSLADQLRNQLINRGIALEDRASETDWIVEDRRKYTANT